MATLVYGDQLPMPRSQADLAWLVMMALTGNLSANQLLELVFKQIMQQRNHPNTPEAPPPDYRLGPGHVAKPARQNRQKMADNPPSDLLSFMPEGVERTSATGESL